MNFQNKCETVDNCFTLFLLLVCFTFSVLVYRVKRLCNQKNSGRHIDIYFFQVLLSLFVPQEMSSAA